MYNSLEFLTTLMKNNDFLVSAGHPAWSNCYSTGLAGLGKETHIL